MQSMRMERAWGTQFEIMGAAAQFGVRVIVWSPMSHTLFQFFGARGRPYIYLHNNYSEGGGNHYDWLRPL
jgi:hypothetical protein